MDSEHLYVGDNWQEGQPKMIPESGTLGKLYMKAGDVGIKIEVDPPIQLKVGEELFLHWPFEVRTKKPIKKSKAFWAWLSGFKPSSEIG